MRPCLNYQYIHVSTIFSLAKSEWACQLSPASYCVIFIHTGSYLPFTSSQNSSSPNAAYLAAYAVTVPECCRAWVELYFQDLWSFLHMQHPTYSKSLHNSLVLMRHILHQESAKVFGSFKKVWKQLCIHPLSAKGYLIELQHCAQQACLTKHSFTAFEVRNCSGRTLWLKTLRQV